MENINKKIAEKYAHSVLDYHKENPLVTTQDWQDQFEELSDTTESILDAISKEYFIIKKEDVFNAYKYPQRHCDPDYPGTMTTQTFGIQKVLKDLFGVGKICIKIGEIFV